MRSALLDILDIFEVNRKECARLLLEYPKWSLPGTFKPKPGAPSEMEPVAGKDWQLESTVIEVFICPYVISSDLNHTIDHSWSIFDLARILAQVHLLHWSYH